MKKFAVIFSVLIVALSLVGCSRLPYREYDVSTKTDNGGNIYSSLFIDVVSYAQEDKSNYEIHVGLRDLNNGTVDETFAAYLGAAIGLALGEQVTFDSYFSEIIGKSDEEMQEYGFYKYKLAPHEYNLRLDSSEYGFFYVSHHYSVVLPSWIASAGTLITGATEVALLGRSLRIDTSSVFYTFCLGLSKSIKTENATRDIKEISGGGAIECVCWDSKTTDLRNITFEYGGMASGWFIVAILAGVIVVIILYFVTRGKGEQISAVTVEKVESDVLDGQISLDEYEKSIENESGKEADGKLSDNEINSERGDKAAQISNEKGSEDDNAKQ